MSIERRTRMGWRIGVVCVLVGAAVLASGCGWLRARRAKAPAYKKITPAVAFLLMADSPDVPVLDLRPPREFQSDTGHLRNARNFPLDRLPYDLRYLSDMREDTLLVYCDAGDCGEQGMAILVTSGFDNAILIEGGIDRWIQEGFKTDITQGRAGQRPTPAAAPEPGPTPPPETPSAEPKDPDLPAEPEPPPPPGRLLP